MNKRPQTIQARPKCWRALQETEREQSDFSCFIHWFSKENMLCQWFRLVTMFTIHRLT